MSLNFIRIIEVPDFKAPTGACEIFLGLILPSVPYLYVSAMCRNRVIERSQSPQTGHAFAVQCNHAIRAIQEKCPHTARWWKNMEESVANDFLVFSRSEVEIINAPQTLYVFSYRNDDEKESVF